MERRELRGGGDVVRRCTRRRLRKGKDQLASRLNRQAKREKRKKV
jgi:hypothetical protein